MHESVSKMVLDRRFSEMKFLARERSAGTCSSEGLLLLVEESYGIPCFLCINLIIDYSVASTYYPLQVHMQSMTHIVKPCLRHRRNRPPTFEIASKEREKEKR